MQALVRSALGQERRFDPLAITSGQPRSTDIFRAGRHVSNVPKSGRWGNRSPSRPSRAAEVWNGFEIDDHLSVRSPLLLNDRTSEAACCSFAS